MSYKYKIIDGGKQPHFLTLCVIGKIPVFTYSKLCNTVLEELKFYRVNSGLKIYSYVIMDNHIHLILSSEHDLSDIVRRLKSHLARTIINALEIDSRNWIKDLLNTLKRDGKRTQTYQFWTENNHPELIQGVGMFNQKIDYIHQNPVRRGLVSTPEAWNYSSAAWYTTRIGLLEMDDIGIF